MGILATLRGLRYPDIDEQANEAHLRIQDLAEDVDGLDLQGLIADRPAAATVKRGTLFFATDELRAYRSDGANWNAVGAGTEIDHAERITDDTTTNTSSTDANLMNNTIGGLTCNVTGEDRRVEIAFQCLGIYHTTASSPVFAYLMINQVQALLVAESSPSTGSGRPLRFTHRMFLDRGTSYMFEIAKRISSAGTGTYLGGATYPISLSVTSVN